MFIKEKYCNYQKLLYLKTKFSHISKIIKKFQDKKGM